MLFISCYCLKKQTVWQHQVIFSASYETNGNKFLNKLVFSITPKTCNKAI